TPEGYTAGGRPLRFFHFSGFAPERPHLLSKYPLSTPRVLLSELPAVAELCAGYMERLRANGYDECIGLSYTFGRTADGLRLDFALRALARFELKDAEAEGRPARVPDPFEPDGAKEFRRWANEPDPSAPRFTRYLVALHRKRPDIAHAFPDLRGWDGERYKEFLLDPNRPEPVIEAELLAPLRRPEPAQRPDSAWTPGGVNVAGYFRAETGVGEGARLLVNALRTAGVPSAVVSFADTHNRQQDPFVVPPGEAVYDTNIVCVNADELPRFAGTVGAPLLDGRYTIGMWAWEVEEFPVPHRASAHLVDEIWMGSRHSAAAVGRYVNKPVLSFPLPVVVPEPPRLDRHTLGLPEGYVFLFCFDYASVAERKNPVGLIEAFCRAFSPGEGPTLVLKSVNGHRHITELERVRTAAGSRPDIVIRDGYVEAGHQHALIAACDAYVSLHRAEGFGLTMAEAMALGKPVIATAYSGNLEYMDERNSFLVPADLVPIPSGHDPYPTTARWAAPDLDAAAEAMRRVHDDPAEAAKRARRAADDIRRDHGPAAAVPFLVARLEVARRSRPGRIPAPNPDMQRLLDGPDVRSATNRGALAHTFRKGVLRVLQHYRDHQRQVDRALLDQIEDLETRRRADLAGISAQLHSGLENLRRWADERQSTVDHLADRVARLDDEITAGPYLSDRDALVTTDDEGREVFGYRNGTAASSPGEVYRRIEDLFRGPEPFIRERQRVYLDLLAAHQPVVDFGCGRGEILDLLVEAGVDHVGVDLDVGMVARCRQKGHTVEHADALDWLRRRPDASLGAVFSAQFIEHIGRDDLMALLGEARRALRPGGIFVAETVNPHSSRALKAFWLDLTHVHPIYPEMALAL
ncbi:MAG TPA: methyltransferase domain-containing protein, partial [Acidimicrobiales bacterium]|nr:methyltransferase domain-containing protein [Acidimicrobiales bacterium]